MAYFSQKHDVLMQLVVTTTIALVAVTCSNERGGTPPENRETGTQQKSNISQTDSGRAPTSDDSDIPSAREVGIPRSPQGGSKGIKLLFLGADDRGLVMIDSSRSPLSVEPVPIKNNPLVGSSTEVADGGAQEGQGISSVVLLSRGTIVAASSKERVAVWSVASGELLSQQGLPDLCHDNRSRTVGRIVEGLLSNPFFHDEQPESARRTRASEEAERQCKEIVKSGIIVRGKSGGLVYDPWFNFAVVYGTEDDSPGYDHKLRTPLDVAVDTQPDPSEASRLWKYTALDAGELMGTSCVEIDVVVEKTTVSPSARDWMTEGKMHQLSCVFRTKTSVTDCFSSSSVGQDPNSGERSNSGVDTARLCRKTVGDGFYLLTSFNYGMGNLPGPWLYGMDGNGTIVSSTGYNSRFMNFSKGSVYGGDKAWYIERPGSNPVLFSTTAVDVISVVCHGDDCTGALPSTPSEPEIDWFCLCYTEASEVGPETSTACRQSMHQCELLERRARSTAGRYVGVAQECRSIRGAHPGHVLGNRTSWQPSSRAGSWWFQGQCLLTR